MPQSAVKRPKGKDSSLLFKRMSIELFERLFPVNRNTVGCPTVPLVQCVGAIFLSSFGYPSIMVTMTITDSLLFSMTSSAPVIQESPRISKQNFLLPLRVATLSYGNVE